MTWTPQHEARPRQSQVQRWAQALLRSALAAVLAMGSYEYFARFGCGPTQDGLSSTTGALVGTGVLTVGGTVLSIYRRAHPRPRAEAEPGDPMAARHFGIDKHWALAWVERNRFLLPADLAAGQGPSIDELSAAAGITPANQVHFGAVLRQHRRDLLAATEPGGESSAAAVAFFNLIGDVISEDALLAADFDATLARMAATPPPLPPPVAPPP